MVNLNNFVLDSGILKSVPEVKMSKQIDYCTYCKIKSNRMMSIKGPLNEETLEYEWSRVPNETYKEPPLKIKYAMKQMDRLESDIMCWNSNKSNKTWFVGTKERNQRFFQNVGSEEAVYDYLEIIPFTPSVMINISPDWKSVKDKLSNRTKIVRLKTIIENYLKESDRYDYYSYVIENGEGGDHIHCHIVAHINPKLLKSVTTHLAKGNHTQQLRKYAKKFKGMEGIIKGVSVQKTFLRSEELVKDKLNYLIENLKPEGHKNKSVIEPGRVDKVLITVK